MKSSLPPEVRLLIGSALLQLLWTTLLGWTMLLPHQPWSKGLLAKLRSKDVTSAHVDWVILALVQIATAFVIYQQPVPFAVWVARGIAYSGWVAPSTYFLRAWGINAFRMDGKKAVEMVAGLIALSGTVAFTIAWCVVVAAWFDLR